MQYLCQNVDGREGDVSQCKGEAEGCVSIGTLREP